MEAAPHRRGFVALCATLALGLGLIASPAEAAPFAYLTSGSVIDTATNPPSVVATIPVGSVPLAVAVSPDGKHVYVANSGSNNVSVIDTATNTLEVTVPVGSGPRAVPSLRTGHAPLSGAPIPSR
jgi:YVTN family beta-propeller protein